MRSTHFYCIRQVAEWRLCLGCGACFYACQNGAIELRDVLEDGIRPHVTEGKCITCGDCLRVCPGYDYGIPKKVVPSGLVVDLDWGPVLEVWEGYAAMPDIRYEGSSGGITSALSLYCIERKGMDFVVHTGADQGKPWINRTVISRTKEEVRACTGSRYSPASPCDGLGQIESATSPCVFVGKPCDIAGLRKAQQMRSGLDRNVGFAIGFFCAGTPSTRATLDLMNVMGYKTEEVAEFRYRGRGWPGEAVIRRRGEGAPSSTMTYEESWGFLQKYRPFRCYLCPDGTAERADVSCGDPWYREIAEGEAGYSLVLVRTEKGREIVRGAIAEGYVYMKQVDPVVVSKSQKNLLMKRRSVWGRIAALRIFGLPVPAYPGMPLFQNWLDLSLKEKVRSVLGTARRIITRKYYRQVRGF